DDVPGRHDGAAPDREVLLVRPDRAAFLDVPSLDHAAVAARPWLEAHFGPDIGGAGDVVRLAVLDVHAEIGMRDVEQAGFRREGGRVPVLGARSRRADVTHHLAHLRAFFADVLQAPGLQIDAGGGRDRP